MTDIYYSILQKGKVTGVTENIMEDNKKEKIEALQVLTEFNERLVKNMKIIVKELSGERLDDTDNFLSAIVNAIAYFTTDNPDISLSFLNKRLSSRYSICSMWN